MRIKGTFIYGQLVYDKQTGTLVETNRIEEPFDVDVEFPDDWPDGETAKRGRK